MRSISLDLFAAAGQDCLAIVDRFSGYAWTVRLSNMTTCHMLSHLEAWFTDFCQAHGITHELASPYNPESNGLGEAAVML